MEVQSRPFPMLLASITIIMPSLLYAFLRLFPEIDPILSSGIVHFYIVTFTSLVALVSASFMYLVIGRQSVEAQFLTLSFVAMAGIFVVHGFSTPGIVIGSNAVVGVAARLSLTVGAIFMVLAVWNYSPQQANSLREKTYLLAFFTLLFLFALTALLFAAPDIVEVLANSALSGAIALITIALLLLSIYQAWRKYQNQANRLHEVLIVALSWLVLAQISQYEAPVWAFSWWLYHIAMLAAYLLTMAFLLSGYEKLQDFRLTRYFVSLGLVLAVPMVFLLGEFAVRLSEREDIRWTLIAVLSLSLLLIMLALFALVYRAQQILNRRREVIEQEKQWRKDMSNLIAHDLLSPLNAIILNLNIMQGQDIIRTDPDIFERITRIQDSSERMSSLVFDILYVERFESSSLELQKTALDFSDLVKAAILQVRSVAEYRDIMVSANLPQDPLMLAVDEKIMLRVMQNLLSNALKFSPNGGKIYVEVGADQAMLRCSVIDNGLGIPQHQRAHVFEPFGQARDSDQQQDFDLGLAFCKLAIEEHGGTIGVEDNPTGGSKFIFVLPLEGI